MSHNAMVRAKNLSLEIPYFHPGAHSITKPLSIEINGSTAGIFDHRLGMSALATGKENIMLRGLQVGLTSKEIKKVMPEVIEFAELDDGALDQPFSTYSNGMKLRLSIATSMMSSPEVLIMDEWIGAGDARFREKLKGHINKILGESKCVIIATHSLQMLKANCNKGLLMEKGKQIYFGPIQEAINLYRDMDKKNEPGSI